MLVKLFPSCDLFRLLGPVQVVVRFFLFPSVFVHLTVGSVSELLIRIQPHELSNAQVSPRRRLCVSPPPSSYPIRAEVIDFVLQRPHAFRLLEPDNA